MDLRELTKYRGRGDLRSNEFKEAANGFIRVVAPEQPSDRIAETLNERSLRYYIAEGLVAARCAREAPRLCTGLGTSCRYRP